MLSVIEKVQQDALDWSVPVTELLLRCILVAAKLSQTEFAAWARLEYDGYGSKKVPKYRHVSGTPQAFNPFYGWRNIEFESLKQKERLSTMHFNQPIGEIEYSLKPATDNSGGIYKVNYHPSTEKRLMESMNTDLTPVLSVNPPEIAKILDAVRKVVLEWSLTLEFGGIQGTGIGFSNDEKQKATGITYNVQTYIFGGIQHSQLQIMSQQSIQQITQQMIDIKALEHFTESLSASIEKLAIEASAKAKLATDLQTVKNESAAANPKHSVLREALHSIRSILEGAASDVIAAGLLYYLQKLVGT